MIMKYTKEQIRQIFQAQFDVTVWTDFIINFFGAQTVRRVPEPLDINPDEGNGYYWGKLSTNDDYDISFFYLKLNNSIDRRKVGLRQLISKYIKIDSDAGIAVFDDGNHWRLSFITDLKAEKTSPKRFTFVFGDPENYYNTATDRFFELQSKGINFSNIREAFSVEALTKQFYNDLFEWFTWATKDDTGVYFPKPPRGEQGENIDTKMIRLITRLMFVWFIKQKGLVPDDLFNPERLQNILLDFEPMSMTSSNYYQAILQNLFFGTLNRPILTPIRGKDGKELFERRCFAKLKDKPDVKSKYRYQEQFKISEDKILSLFEFVPFINGGLFECLDKNTTSDGVEKAYYHDGFSRNRTIENGRYTRRAFVPNKLFFDQEDGILSIFKRYNFTVEENSPNEQQIALDPELLGKVFENLLGVYNPETHDTARNQSGSFYTPREIVNYMVDRSLEAYLGNAEEVKALFKEDFEYDESHKDFYDEVIAKLKTIKVLDPACGSGAFPIGMLNRIVEILENLRAEGTKYDLKLQIMENCIFGGDIQTIAAQITKLRFFISLVCDCEKNDDANDNFGIPNLPNLETHFVTGDSLIQLKRSPHPSLFEQDVIALQNRLQDVRHEHFTAKTVYQKNKLRDRDKELREELATMLQSDNVYASESAHMMAEWNPYDQNGKAKFFDAKWMFGIEDGFDIVIGNPPYIRLQKNGGELAYKYIGQNYFTFDRNGDMYCLFYEMGYNNLKKGGHLCYITSNKWMKTGYGEKTRELFSKKTNPMLLIDFGGVKIFESATVDTNILLFAKGENLNHTICAVTNKQNKDSVKDLSVFVQQQHSISNFASSDSWVILSEIEQSIKRKIESIGTPLKDWDIRINYGIKTGFNDAFIITTEKRDEILANCVEDDERIRTAELIRPILRGRDIKRYGYDWAGLWLINTHNGIRGVKPMIDINDYPAIRHHLDKYWAKISKRADKGNTPYNLRNCAYVDDFELPKIVYMEIQTDNPSEGYPFPCFSYDDRRAFVLNTGYILCSKEIDVRYILGILNSSLGGFIAKLYVSQLQERQFRMLAQFVSKFPIPKSDSNKRNELVELVKQYINNYDPLIEEKINDTVLDLYCLNEEEKAYIRSL